MCCGFRDALLHTSDVTSSYLSFRPVFSGINTDGCVGKSQQFLIFFPSLGFELTERLGFNSVP